MAVTEQQVLEALKSVEDPDLHADIVTLKFVKDVKIEGGKVAFSVELTTPACPVKDELEKQAHDAVAAIEGVDSVDVTMTARVMERAPSPEDLLPDVKQCIAIASGKGGVGKSTVTVNLAAALAKSGAKVGILDADVYGPSIPLMMGVADERPLSRDEKIVPIEKHGIKMMSLGFLLEDGQAVMWRGPMVASTVRQLLSDVDWGELDYLLVDLPPGTGDAPMSLAQLAPLTGVVIVTTPHSVAANIAGKSAALFRRLNCKILGVIENMAEFVCPKCDEKYRLFAGQPGEELAKEIGSPFLGSVPLDPVVGEAASDGEPSVLSHPDRPQANAFTEISGAMAAQVSIAAASKPKSEVTAEEFQPVSE